MIKILKYGEVANSEIFARDNIASNVEGIVTDIIASVVSRGDAAVLEYCEKFDKARLSSLEVTAEEIEEAFSLVDNEFIEIIKEAAENIREFHKRQVRNSFVISEKDGVVIGQGTHQELMAGCETYREIYKSQMGLELEEKDKGES